MMKTVQELSNYVQGTVIGDASLSIEGVTNIEAPQEGYVTFIQNEKSFAKLENSEIACLIVPENITQSSKTLIQVKNPKLAWAKILGLFHPEEPYSGTISDQAFIAEDVTLGSNVTVEPFATISEGCSIGDNSVIRSNTHLDKNVSIGKQSVIHPHVMIYKDCVIGNQVIIHAQTVIGADGFGYVPSEQGQQKVPQVGIVVIEDGVEIGASVTIDRATVGQTTISQGCKIDNLVQIGHNVFVGPHTVISSQTGISGSSKIGAFVTMGGKVGVGDHVEIGDWVMVGAGAGLPTGKKIPPKQIIFGAPARPYQEARKQIAAQLKAAEMYASIKELKKKVERFSESLPQES